MSAIDITTMRGEMPRAVPHLLPEQAATIAKNCHFRHGVITPVMTDIDGGKTFKLQPTTIFRYRDDYWFAWTDLVDAIRSPVAQDKYERVYFIDGKYPKVTSNEIATQGNGNFPAVSFRLGIPAPSNPIEVTAITPPADHGDDDPTDDDTRFYVETYVTGYGEEGPPGPVSQEVTIVYPGSTVDLALQPPGSQNSNITRRRIYRSASGGGVADYLLLVELAIGVLSYQDTSLDKELGPVLETENFLMPPDEMIGLCLMANGIAAGFAGNQVMFSEAFLPYAWPDSYKQSTEHDIVATAPIGAGLVVGTKGRSYLLSGITPSNMTNTKLPVMQACVSRRSMVSMDSFALYALPNGLVSVDGAGNTLVATEQIIEPRQWRKNFNPESIKTWQVEGEYLAIYQTAKGIRAGFIFDPQAMDIRHLTTVFDTAFKGLSFGEWYTGIAVPAGYDYFFWMSSYAWIDYNISGSQWISGGFAYFQPYLDANRILRVTPHSLQSVIPASYYGAYIWPGSGTLSGYGIQFMGVNNFTGISNISQFTCLLFKGEIDIYDGWLPSHINAAFAADQVMCYFYTTDASKTICISPDPNDRRYRVFYVNGGGGATIRAKVCIFGNGALNRRKYGLETYSKQNGSVVYNSGYDILARPKLVPLTGAH